MAKIAPHFTMKRMIDDYIERFYDKEAKRYKKLHAHDFALAKEIVAWKEKVAQGMARRNAVSVEEFNVDPANTRPANRSGTIIKLDANGPYDLGVECVIYKIEDGQEKYEGREEFKMVGEEGNICTFELKTKTPARPVHSATLTAYILRMPSFPTVRTSPTCFGYNPTVSKHY